MLRVIPFLGAVSFIGFAIATVVLLIRAEWAPRADGSRRGQRPQSRHQIWPDPARIPPAGRRFERLARRTAGAAVLAFFFTWFALAAF